MNLESRDKFQAVPRDASAVGGGRVGEGGGTGPLVGTISGRNRRAIRREGRAAGGIAEGWH
jgi:hypothetical protein